MKLTELKIAPSRPYSPVSAANPMKAVVRLEAEQSNVETVLSDETMRKLLELCAAEIAANAERNVREFVAAVNAVETEKGAALIGADFT